MFVIVVGVEVTIASLELGNIDIFQDVNRSSGFRTSVSNSRQLDRSFAEALRL